MMYIRDGGAVDVVGLLVVGLDLVVLICEVGILLERTFVLDVVHWDSNGEVGGVGDLLGGVDLLGDGFDGGPVIDGDVV